MAQDPCAVNAHRIVTLTWTPNANVSDGTHDLKVYRSRNGEARVLMFTETAPKTNTSRTGVECGVVTQTTPAPLPDPTTIVIAFTYELVAGASLIEAGAFPENECTGILC